MVGVACFCCCTVHTWFYCLAILCFSMLTFISTCVATDACSNIPACTRSHFFHFHAWLTPCWLLIVRIVKLFFWQTMCSVCFRLLLHCHYCYYIVSIICVVCTNIDIVNTVIVVYLLMVCSTVFCYSGYCDTSADGHLICVLWILVNHSC